MMLMPDAPETQYARRGTLNIAYQVVGAGPRDVVLVSPWLSSLEAGWDIPEWKNLYHRFAAFSRFILFDKSGMGLSDPLPQDALPTLRIGRTTFELLWMLLTRKRRPYLGSLTAE